MDPANFQCACCSRRLSFLLDKHKTIGVCRICTHLCRYLVHPAVARVLAPNDPSLTIACVVRHVSRVCRTASDFGKVAARTSVLSDADFIGDIMERYSRDRVYFDIVDDIDAFRDLRLSTWQLNRRMVKFISRACARQALARRGKRTLETLSFAALPTSEIPAAIRVLSLRYRL
eukprot:jgi/Mesvir1/5632/Mv15650-RA.1